MIIWLLACLCHITAIFASQPLHLNGNQLSPEMMQYLVDTFHTEVLVETGTWGGRTAANASKFFQEVYTVELSHDLFLQGSRFLENIPHVHALEGHSPAILEKIIPSIQGKILFWLDAHWCGEGTAHFGKNTPIQDELEVIRKSGVKNAVILIDDIRCFHNLPDDVLGYGGYPTLQEIKAQVLAINPSYSFYILGDMAIAVPDEERPPISPLVQACTTSRLFEGVALHDSSIIEVESAFRTHCNDPEAHEIDFLQCLVIPSTEFITYHLILWEGLLQLGRANYQNAANCFKKVLASGYTHERVYQYLAEAESRTQL